MESSSHSRATILIAAFAVVGLCVFAIMTSLHVVEFGTSLRETAQRLEMMTSVADAEAAGH